MIGFVLNGFVFVLIGLELPSILEGLGGRPPSEIVGLAALGQRRRRRRPGSSGCSRRASCPGRLGGQIARRDPALATRLTFVVGWAGLRGAVSLAAALALPSTSPSAT